MIRLMEVHDIPQLALLFLKSRRHTFHWVDPARFKLEDFEVQTKGEQVWVAEQGGNICGFIAIWLPDHFVHHLYVSRDWHGQALEVVHEFGRDHHLALLTTPRIQGGRPEATECLCIAGRLQRAVGTFIDQQGDVALYFTILHLQVAVDDDLALN